MVSNVDVRNVFKVTGDLKLQVVTMMKMLDQLIRKVVLPVAEQNGYYLDPERIPSG